jgi:hypothetical protein
MAALGLPLSPGDAGDDSSEDADAVIAPQQLVDMDYAGFQPQMMPCHGGSNDHVGDEGLLEQFLMNPGYGLECVSGGRYDEGAVYDMEAPGDDDAFEDGVIAPQQLVDMDYAGFQPQMMPCHDGGDDHVGGEGLLLEQFLMNPEYDLECVSGGNYDAGAVYDMGAPAGYGDNAGCGWPVLTMSYAAGESWDEVMPVGYYADGALAPEHYSAQYVAGGDYANDRLPLQYPMGMYENFANHGMDNSYAAHWQAEEFQSCGTGTGHYQYQCSGPRTGSSGQSP